MNNEHINMKRRKKYSKKEADIKLLNCSKVYVTRFEKKVNYEKENIPNNQTKK